MEIVKEHKVYAYNYETTITMLRQDNGLYTVRAVCRFPSGNYLSEEHANLSDVAAEGVMVFYGYTPKK